LTCAVKNKAECFFSPNTQFENVGDALINREMIKLAATYGRVHLNLSRCPHIFAETLNVDHVGLHYSSFMGLLIHMLSLSFKGHCCYYFLSPGGYVGEIKLCDIPSKILNSLVLVLMWLFKIRVCLVGVSYERLGLRARMVQKLRSHFFYCHFVRDELSKHYAQYYKFKLDGIVPDLAFNIFSGTPLEKGPIPPRRVALSFRTDQYPAQIEHIQKTVIELVDLLPPETDYIFVVQVERDQKNMEYLKDSVEQRLGRSITLTIAHKSIENCLASYAGCDLVISNRLHALLIGASQTGHMVAIIYNDKNRKIEGIMAELNLQGAIVQTSAPSSKELGAIIHRAMSLPVQGFQQRQKLHEAIRTLLQTN